ncbi:hypothetical protein CDV31_004054 [Fusarium ambrosium]|uniref:Uncharacterized protein n=1 Tax=Fusarium ambrosium TaxID=131363 RepID=A0A428US90_9HYPO|nr:hypothetical protein CDV31_004054 [Fusarium ambrosium]
MHIRRTIRFSITLPDSTKAYPAIDLKGFNIWLTELRFGRERAHDIKKRGQEQARDLFRTSGDSSDVLPSANSGPASSHLIETSSTEASIKFSVHTGGQESNDKQVENLKALQNRMKEPVVGIDQVNRLICRDINSTDFKYHDNRARRLRHLFSIIAKIISRCTNNKTFWIQNTPFLLQACLKLASGNKALDDWHILLQTDVETLALKFIPPSRKPSLRSR